MPTRHTVRNLIWTAPGLPCRCCRLPSFICSPCRRRWSAICKAACCLALRQHYNAEVQLQNLHITLLPEFYATADNFVLPNRGGPDLPPLITVKHVTVRAGVFELLRTPVHLSWLKLDGLVIQVAPKRDRPAEPRFRRRPETSHSSGRTSSSTKWMPTTPSFTSCAKIPAVSRWSSSFAGSSCARAGIGQPMNFTAELTNPTPPGLIETTGHFGPWDFDEPSATKVDGHYNFQHADLSVFNGISGILSSVGEYRGVLHNIVVDGTTDVPDFQLDHGGQPVHLTTQFHAIVDGTNGNTYLQPVNAHFLNYRRDHQRRSRRQARARRARRSRWTSTLIRRACRTCCRSPQSPTRRC